MLCSYDYESYSKFLVEPFSFFYVSESSLHVSSASFAQNFRPLTQHKVHICVCFLITEVLSDVKSVFLQIVYQTVICGNILSIL